MRSEKPDLEEVLEQFEGWRTKPHGRLIPDELWKAAVSLLDRYSPSTICSRLRLNAIRFKQVREAGIAKPNGALARRRLGQAEGRSVRSGRTASGRITTLATGRNAFIELPALGVGRGTQSPSTLREVDQVPTGCRLTLESAYGTLSVVTLRNSDEGLIDAMCRFVLGAIAGSSRA